MAGNRTEAWRHAQRVALPTEVQVIELWANAICDALIAHGVRDIVLSPGSRSAPLVLAATKSPALRSHVIVDERVAGFFALGLARASERAVALLCTSGSAGAHYAPALIEARHSAVPVIAITADRPAEAIGFG